MRVNMPAIPVRFGDDNVAGGRAEKPRVPVHSLIAQQKDRSDFWMGYGLRRILEDVENRHGVRLLSTFIITAQGDDPAEKRKAVDALERSFSHCPQSIDLIG